MHKKGQKLKIFRNREENVIETFIYCMQVHITLILILHMTSLKKQPCGNEIKQADFPKADD